MKLKKIDSLQRKKTALANELAKIEQNLDALANEEAAKREEAAKAKALLCGAVLYRAMKQRHEADARVAEHELSEWSAVLTDRKERKAFGLPPLAVGQSKRRPLTAI